MQVNNRLFEIVYILMQKRKTTAKELADRFEVSTRTIYRDIETLSTANIPIYASKGKDGGIGLLDEYVLNKTILSEEEQNQILFALQGMKKVKGQEHFERELPKEEDNEKYNFKIIELELEINKAMTYRVYDEFESKEITKKQDGNFMIKVKYPENEWVYGYILSFGEHAKVLSTGYAKNIIKDKLQKTLKNYL